MQSAKRLSALHGARAHRRGLTVAKTPQAKPCQVDLCRQGSCVQGRGASAAPHAAHAAHAVVHAAAAHAPAANAAAAHAAVHAAAGVPAVGGSHRALQQRVVGEPKPAGRQAGRRTGKEGRQAAGHGSNQSTNVGQGRQHLPAPSWLTTILGADSTWHKGIWAALGKWLSKASSRAQHSKAQRGPHRRRPRRAPSCCRNCCISICCCGGGSAAIAAAAGLLLLTPGS
jgi:hypothetical protein